MRLSIPAAILLVVLAALPLVAQGPSGDAASVTAVVNAFHAAVKAGDAKAAAELLAADAVFLEGGAIETRAEYVANHLPEDIRFEQAVSSAYKADKVTVLGDAAWVISGGDLSGTFENKPVNLTLVELMVLSRESQGWRIRAIHWSSRRRPVGAG